MFAPEIWFMRIRINLLAVLLCGVLVLGVPRLTGGMFGISIPANYGNWFANMGKLYLEHQHYLAKAREIMVVALTVSQTVKALENMDGATREEFVSRWRRNARTILQANILFQLDQEFFDGNEGVTVLLSDVLGIRRVGESYTLDPGNMKVLGLSILANEDWVSDFNTGRVPLLPTYLVTKSAFDLAANEALSDQKRFAFSPFGKKLTYTISNGIWERILANPMAFLNCAGFSPCWSPFGRQWTWPEMEENMFGRGDLHSPLPLADELLYEGEQIRDMDPYIHRRLSAHLWRKMGLELKEKLDRLYVHLQKSHRDLVGAVHDVENLVKFVQQSMAPLDSWDSLGNANLASVIATGLSLSGGGTTAQMAKFRSFIDGMIAKKIDVVLQRTREVQTRVDFLLHIVKDLKDQIAGYRGGRRRQTYQRWFYQQTGNVATEMVSIQPAALMNRNHYLLSTKIKGVVGEP